MLWELRQSVGEPWTEAPAWERGYESARRVKQALRLGNGPVPLDRLQQLTTPIEVPELNALGRVDAIVSRNGSRGGAAVAEHFAERRPASARFLLARLLGESLLLEPSGATLLTKERTSRQKANRAFAAELLAPANEVAARLPGTEVSREEVADLAEEFEVSSFVIENQLQNHGLARVVD